MPFVDHEHTHKWECIGIAPGQERMHPDVIYQCTGCDAWTALDLHDTAYVEFSNGELATGPQEESGGGDE
jgi:hypothetical protein